MRDRLFTRFSSLKYSDFRKLLVAKATSAAGFWLTFIALYGIFVFEEGIGPLQIGLMSLVTVVPKAFGGPVMGVVVDRLSRRRILIYGEIATAMLTLSLVFVRVLAFAYVVLFLNSLISSLTAPATKAIVPQIIDDEDELAKANGLLSSAGSTAQIVGPSVAGALLFVGSPMHLFVVDAITSLLGAGLVFLMADYRASPDDDRTAFSEFKAGLSMVYSSRAVAGTLTVGFLVFGAMGVYDAMIPLYTREVLFAGESDLGLIISMVAGGSLVAGVVTGAGGDRIHPTTGIAVGMFVDAAMIALLTVVSDVLPALAISVFIGFATTLTIVYCTTYLQMESENEVMGRVMGLFTGFARTGQILAVFFASLVIERIGLLVTFGAIAAVLLVAVLVPLSLWRVAERTPQAVAAGGD